LDNKLYHQHSKLLQKLTAAKLTKKLPSFKKSGFPPYQENRASQLNPVHNNRIHV
jgi:hypothetical protein